MGEKKSPSTSYKVTLSKQNVENRFVAINKTRERNTESGNPHRTAPVRGKIKLKSLENVKILHVHCFIIGYRPPFRHGSRGRVSKRRLVPLVEYFRSPSGNTECQKKLVQREDGWDSRDRGTGGPLSRQLTSRHAQRTPPLRCRR